MVNLTLKNIGLAVLSGVLLTLPFLNFSLSPLAWIALIPLILVCADRRVSDGAIFGFLTGIIYGYGGLFWLARVTGGGYGILGGYLALYVAAWGGVDQLDGNPETGLDLVGGAGGLGGAGIPQDLSLYRFPLEPAGDQSG